MIGAAIDEVGLPENEVFCQNNVSGVSHLL